MRDRDPEAGEGVLGRDRRGATVAASPERAVLPEQPHLVRTRLSQNVPRTAQRSDWATTSAAMTTLVSIQNRSG